MKFLASQAGSSTNNTGVRPRPVIDGVEVHSPWVSRDSRGSFEDFYRDNWGYRIVPRQWSLVHSKQRVLRGMHYHHRHEELFMLVAGHALVGLYDARPESGTFGVAAMFEFDESRSEVLIFPRGVVHGWYFFSDSIHIQSVSESYDTYGVDDNHRCRWDDADLGLQWPDPDPILSPQAAAAGSLAELLAKPAQ